jgi:mono/diheme cytochrome c family protein
MKTKINKHLVAGTLTICAAMVCMSFIKIQDAPKTKWVVPEASKKVTNPGKVTAESKTAGETLYVQHCKSCHGSSGKGDGPKAKKLETLCGDFTTAAFKAQTEGEIFYKAKEGRDDMPSFKKKIKDDEDIWNIVVYVKSLGNK